MAMQFKPLGRTGLFVSRLGLGSSTFGGAHHPLYNIVGGLAQNETDRIVGFAIDAGINLFDSADVYAEGESDTRLGKALGARRTQVLVSAKVGNRAGDGANDVGHSRTHMLRAIEGCLRRLGTDYIDILQLHIFDPLTRLDDVMRTLNDVVRAGKVRYLGCSNFAAWQFVKAMGIAKAASLEPFSAIQVYYSVVSRDIEREVLPAAIDQGVGIFTWSPLAGGLLSGKFARNRQPDPAARRPRLDFPPVNLQHAYQVIDALELIAARHRATVAQVALAWQLRQNGISAAITGARNADQLRENLGCFDVELTTEDLAAIDSASKLPAEYPGWYQSMPMGRMPGAPRGLLSNVKNDK